MNAAIIAAGLSPSSIRAIDMRRLSANPTPHSSSQAQLAPSIMIDDILVGPGDAHKHINSKFLYDARGSILFERLATLPEYYPTRTASAIPNYCADAIARAVSSILMRPFSCRNHCSSSSVTCF